MAEAADVLEESRIEAAQIRRRRDDRHWLRASATHLILADTRANSRTRAPGMTRAEAARSAALLVARVDAGILTARETAPVRQVVDTVLGADTVAELRRIWRAAHQVGDDDLAAMLDLGRRWCAAVGTDPATPDPTGGSGTPGGSGGSGGSGGGRSRGRSPLAKAITASANRVRRAVATEPVPADPPTRAEQQRAAEQAARQTAATTAQQVFRTDPRPGVTPRITGTRPPTTAERTAARTVGRALTTAGVPDRTATTTTSPVPPGRVRMRGVLAAEAQRAAGALPTAQPFTRTTRRTVPAPPLRLGIACDVSASMSEFTGPVASAAWILAHAARHTPIPTTTATVIFGSTVLPITPPGAIPTEVTDFRASGGEENIGGAIDALDGALELFRPGAARLLVIVSDGKKYYPEHRTAGQRRVDRLRAAGCGVLWLAPDADEVDPLTGVTVLALTDPTATALAIGRAATAALRAATR